MPADPDPTPRPASFEEIEDPPNDGDTEAYQNPIIEEPDFPDEVGEFGESIAPTQPIDFTHPAMSPDFSLGGGIAIPIASLPSLAMIRLRLTRNLTAEQSGLLWAKIERDWTDMSYREGTSLPIFRYAELLGWPMTHEQTVIQVEKDIQFTNTTLADIDKAWGSTGEEPYNALIPIHYARENAPDDLWFYEDDFFTFFPTADALAQFIHYRSDAERRSVLTHFDRHLGGVGDGVALISHWPAVDWEKHPGLRQLIIRIGAGPTVLEQVAASAYMMHKMAHLVHMASIELITKFGVKGPTIPIPAAHIIAGRYMDKGLLSTADDAKDVAQRHTPHTPSALDTVRPPTTHTTTRHPPGQRTEPIASSPHA